MNMFIYLRREPAVSTVKILREKIVIILMGT